MPYGQLVLGPPGAGKSTYCHGLQQVWESIPKNIVAGIMTEKELTGLHTGCWHSKFLTALERPVTIVNLDPASPNPPYPHHISLTSLITLQDVMEEFNLGPNGALLYCLEYLEKNVDWLMEELGKLGKDAYVAFDMPGQVELGTDHPSTKKVISTLEKSGWRMAAVHLCDAHYITDASKYLSVLLVSLRTMLQLELPHVNVLSKIDLVTSYSDLPFNLDFYTEVQDLSYLLPHLENETRSTKFSALNSAIIELVEDFGLVGFETLCVEDKKSMIHLVKAVDQALGYIYIPASSTSTSRGSDENQNIPIDFDPTTVMRETNPLERSYVHEVQEKFVDYADDYRDWERDSWKQEGDEAIRVANQLSMKEARERNAQGSTSSNG